MNNLSMVGRIVRDIELRTAGETSVADVTLAVQKAYDRDKADFINCVVWGKSAEALAQYAGKGTQISIIGRLENANYENPEGEMVYRDKVTIDKWSFVGGKSDNTSENDNGGDDEESPF